MAEKLIRPSSHAREKLQKLFEKHKRKEHNPLRPPKATSETAFGGSLTAFVMYVLYSHPPAWHEVDASACLCTINEKNILQLPV